MKKIIILTGLVLLLAVASYAETWMDDCNTCTGDRYGVFSCTTMYCGPAVNSTYEWNYFVISGSGPDEIAKVTSKCKIIKQVPVGPYIQAELDRWRGICLEIKEIDDGS